MAHQFRQHVEGAGPHDHFVMIGAIVLGDGAGMGQFAVFFEADRKRLHLRAGKLAHQRHDDARIHAAAQQRSERDVGDQAQTHGLAQHFEQSLGGLFFVQIGLGRAFQPPVALDARRRRRMRRLG